MNIIEIVHPFPETLLQPLLGNDSLQANSADNEDHTSESVCLLLEKRRYLLEETDALHGKNESFSRSCLLHRCIRTQNK